VRTRRILFGKDVDVGVAGRTLTLPLPCGLRACFPWPEECPDMLTAGLAIDAEDVDEALECEWWWCGMERILETDEDVDLRPRSPPEERRYEDRGVSGAGDADKRRVPDPEPFVDMRGRGGMCVDGGTDGCVCTEFRFAVLSRLLGSGLLASGCLGLWPVLLAFEPGLFARLLVSLIQLRRLRK
jgi:hypothetical protein